MVYSYGEMMDKYNDDYNLKIAMEKEEVYKISRGIYADKKNVNPMLVYAKKYPNTVYTMDSAFYYYDLTDVIPDKLHIATSANARSFNNKDIVQYYMDDKLLNIGKEMIKLNNSDDTVYMYNKERLLIELIRKRNKIQFDYYKEIINNYRNIVDELDMNKIEEYLDCFKNSDKIFEIMQREVF